jgi:hypothetical protein
MKKIKIDAGHSVIPREQKGVHALSCLLQSGIFPKEIGLDVLVTYIATELVGKSMVVIRPSAYLSIALFSHMARAKDMESLQQYNIREGVPFQAHWSDGTRLTVSRHPPSILQRGATFHVIILECDMRLSRRSTAALIWCCSKLSINLVLHGKECLHSKYQRALRDRLTRLWQEDHAICSIGEQGLLDLIMSYVQCNDLLPDFLEKLIAM